MSRLTIRPIICLVTDRHTRTGALLAHVAEAACAGVDLIQLRERDLDDRTHVALARDAVSAVRATAARLLVNDRLDVALAAGAGGVHLRADSVPAPGARSLLGDSALIGRSVHSVEEARAAQHDGGIDYLMFGTIFPSPAKPSDHRYAGVEGLRAVCESVRLPVIAIGGVTVDGASRIAAAGAAGVAAIGLFSRSSDLRLTVGQLRDAFDTPSTGV